MRKLMTLAMLAALTTTAACNTVRGAGKDVKSVGTAIEKTTK